jgi:hypothetical protein
VNLQDIRNRAIKNGMKLKSEDEILNGENMNLSKILELLLLAYKLITSPEFKSVAGKIVEFLKGIEKSDPEKIQTVRAFRQQIEKDVFHSQDSGVEGP